VALISLGSSAANAHLVDVTSVTDLRRHLEEIDIDDDEAAAVAERFLYVTVKLEGVDTRAANLLRSSVETLGGSIAMRKEARDFTVREADLIVSGSRAMFRLLAARLKGEPHGLEAIGESLLACLQGGNRVMTWGRRALDFTYKTYVMGILNCTPDSFFPASRTATLKEALAAAHAMVDAGVDIIDVGGESSRPGSDPVRADEEIRRVIPVIQAIRGFSDVLISVDTRKAEVAERALDGGADIVNDISGLREKDLADLVARRKVPIILMHMRGTPKTMQKSPSYRNTISEILRELEPSVAAALGAGISRDLIIIDPGIGFGKRVQDNLRIIRELSSLKSLAFPIMVGLSRKAFIGELLDRPVERRLIGTVTANTLAIINGANIIRVHDVADAVEMVTIIDSVRRLAPPRAAGPHTPAGPGARSGPHAPAGPGLSDGARA
jgi:dihydropteroate synthase